MDVKNFSELSPLYPGTAIPILAPSHDNVSSGATLSSCHSLALQCLSPTKVLASISLLPTFLQGMKESAVAEVANPVTICR